MGEVGQSQCTHTDLGPPNNTICGRGTRKFTTLYKYGIAQKEVHLARVPPHQPTVLVETSISISPIAYHLVQLLVYLQGDRSITLSQWVGLDLGFSPRFTSNHLVELLVFVQGGKFARPPTTNCIVRGPKSMFFVWGCKGGGTTPR